MVVQFLRAFGKVLRMEVSEVPTLGALQEGLLNLGNGMGQVQDLLAKSILGDHLTNIGLNRDNVSEVLQQYMEAHCSHSGQLADITLSLKTKAFQTHTPAQKASVLAFLVNELACSKSVVSEIDKSLDQMTVLRKDECIVEGKLKKLKTIHGKRTGKREGGTGGEEPQVSGTPSTGTKRKRKGGDSDEDEDEEDDSDEAGEDDEEEEEEEVKKGKKIEMCDEDEGDQATSVEELEKQIEKLSKQNLIKRKLFESSHALRSMAYGQDRYHRRYWVLPQCGGVFIEGLESGEGPEELERERERLRSFEAVRVKEEPEEEMQDGEQGEGPQGEEPQGEEPPGLVKQEEDHPEEVKQEDEQPVNTDQEPRGDGEGDRCASLPKEIQETEPQQPDPASSQTPLLKEPPIASDEGAALCHTSNGCPATVTPATAVPASPTRSTSSPAVPCGAPADPVAAPPPLFGAPPPPFSIPPSLQQQAQLLANDQLLRVLTERSGHWFSLLPRTPCDDSSLTWPASPPQASPQPAGGPHVHARTPPPPCSSHHHFHPPCTSVIDGPGNHAMSQAQLKAIAALMPLPVCGWTGGLTSAGLPACSSPVPMCPLTEGSPSPLLAPSISTSKSGSPAPPADKTLSAPSPAIDLPRNHDHPQPQPIPEDMLTGWWKVMDVEQLQTLLKTLHSRGVRERTLHKQVQKSIDLITQTCSKNREVAVMEVSELDEGQVSVETLQEWCVEEQAMETDIALLQQVEELERKATSASLQVKGWVHPEPQSEREDMVYHEHKPLPKPRPGAESQEERSSEKGLWRRASNPLDIAVTRLAELERHLERRYLRSPLGTTIQIRLDNVGTVTVPAPAPSTSTGGEGVRVCVRLSVSMGEEEIAPGMKVWRKALSEVRNSSQLAMCLQQLQKSIAWERSIMKVYCQMCRKGDNEDLLLLCDGCDKGCHTYCHKPKISCIPEGDWYCPACISKASGQSPKNKKSQSRIQSSGGGKKSAETGKKGKKQAEAPEEEHSGVGGGGAGGGATGGAGGGASGSTSNNSPKKATTTSGQAKKSSPAPPPGPPATVPPGNNANEGPACVKRAKTARDNNRDLGLCRILLAELERHQDAGPFLTPVNLKSVPGYRKVIKKPMDFSTIREKLVSSQYQNLETFIIDVNLVFDNCEKFNEDNSDIGRAGHNMRNLDTSPSRFPRHTGSGAHGLRMVSLICTLQNHLDDVNCCSFSASLLATCSADKTVRVYRTRDFTELPFSPLSGHGYGVHCCCFSPCGQYLASCSTDATTVVWAMGSGEIEAVLEHPGRSPVRVCAFSPASSHLVSGAADGSVALWDFPSRRLRRTGAVPDTTIVACSFSPCGQLVATGSTYGDLRIWDLSLNQLHAEKYAHDLGVTCCQFAPQILKVVGGCVVQFRLASCGQDSFLKVWFVSLTSPTAARVLTACPFADPCGTDEAACASQEAGRKWAGHFKLMVSEWSEDDVSAWLREEGLESLVDTFKANNIDGAELLSLSKESLSSELNIESLGLRSRVLRKLEQLRAAPVSDGVPDEYLCPITHEVMKDPVIAADGYSYEREAIESWIGTRSRSSPMTNLPLQTTLLTPNRTLKMAIFRWSSSR
ncbi:hypothetical protein P4O66_000580 [Electrophorus voltai]|uniref:WD repeat, SAM and U-box domain-containing protein 1 n=1 Tax=Electrophorus voltai TaxID=2609070 RepID=A0AAD8ZIE1_9TELE|nr:hypothetical protein P4O66_000580 [Electrophorus voltai]